jgi:hypothetical protein
MLALTQTIMLSSAVGLNEGLKEGTPLGKEDGFPEGAVDGT